MNTGKPIEQMSEGPRWTCHVCGKLFVVVASIFGDATCGHCGSLTWPHPRPSVEAISCRDELLSLGAKLYLDPETRSWEIDLGDSLADDSSLLLLWKFGAITELQLTGRPITDKGARSIGHLSSLDVLELGDTQVSNRGLKEIGKLRSLELLTLDRTAITDRGLKHISRLKKLWSLDLDQTAVTNRGVEYLSGLKRLEWLYLSETNIDERVLPALQAFPLKELWIERTRVTRDGFERFKNQLKPMVIHWSEAGAQ